MAYVPPCGWIETSQSRQQRDVYTFHAAADCSKIRAGAPLTPTDRPYSARRCQHCTNM